MTSPIAHFNGKLLPIDEIRVSPLDRGFIFGDGVYEVIPVYDGAMLRAREHFERLQRSMDEIQLKNPHTVAEWIAATEALLEHHPGNQSVYIHVTRGAPKKRDHVIPKDLEPTVFMMCYPLASPSREARTRRVSSALPFSGTRRTPPASTEGGKRSGEAGSPSTNESRSVAPRRRRTSRSSSIAGFQHGAAILQAAARPNPARAHGAFTLPRTHCAGEKSRTQGEQR